ncbi:MAG TPA: peptidylprolyl isomerase [Steroidobacteraceae bacterium]|nr:peptidylprolyl isomerase [Steroidobacteraceae bacterium]
MSTTLVEDSVAVRKPAKARAALPPWAREPLLHFILLGGVLFAADHMLASRKDDPRVITIDPEVDAQAVKVFKDARGHAPNEQELYALRRVWLDNEVLYREGMAMGLDKGDNAIRERVIFKALSVVDANVKKPEIDEAGLRKWFEAHRSRYDEPARFDFEEAVISGKHTDDVARSFADALNAGNPGEIEAGLRMFTHRPHANIVEAYGAEFASALEASPPGEWRALPGKDGMRVMRLKSTSPPKPAQFEELGGIVYQDWTDSVMSEQRSEAVRALAKKYTVKLRSGAQ